MESVLFSDRSGCTPAFGGISAATSIRYRRGVACGLSSKSKGFWPRHAVFGLRMTNPESIGRLAKYSVAMWTSPTEPDCLSFIALRRCRASRNITLSSVCWENYQSRLNSTDKNFKYCSISFAYRRCD